MWCNDFIFDGERLSSFDLMICNFDGSNDSWSGGDVTFTTIQSPNSDIFTYYTSRFETPISFSFSICKNTCKIKNQQEMFLTQKEQAYLMRWLQKVDGYHWLAFDQEGWEDVWFHVQINPQPYYWAGHIIGYTLNCTADSPYGYSKLLKKSFTLKTGNTNNSITIKNYSDIVGNIYPRIKINALNNGTIRLESGSENNHKITAIENVINGTEIILDKENDFIYGIPNMNNFNYVFPILSNEYGNIDTFFTNIGEVDIEIEITYRFVRRVSI